PPPATVVSYHLSLHDALPISEGEIHRERRAAQRHQPVRCLLDEQHRYSVAVPGHVLLHGGVRLGAALGRDSAAPAHRRPRIRAQHPVQRPPNRSTSARSSSVTCGAPSTQRTASQPFRRWLTWPTSAVRERSGSGGRSGGEG